jgi:hypothetical protein
MTNRRSSRQLLVEGSDDKWAVINLMAKHGYNFDHNDSVYIRECQGVSRLLELIPEVYKQSDLSSLGIIVDSDDFPVHRWTSIRNRLTSLGLEVPVELPPSGSIVADGNRKVGVWLMPNNEARGMLEDFLAYLVPDNDEVWAFADESTTKAQSLSSKLLFKDLPKAKMHTWLAWQKEPGKPIGTAISAGFLSGNSCEVDTSRNWFTDVFDVTAAVSETRS